MKTLKTSLVILTLLAVVAATSIANASELLLIPEDQSFSTFKNVVTGKPTESIVPPVGCLLSGVTSGHTVIAIHHGAPSVQFTVYTNGVVSPGDKVAFVIPVDVCSGHKIFEVGFEKATAEQEEAASWDCLAFVPDDQAPSTFKNVVSGKPTASIVDPPDALETGWGFVGEQMGHTVHAIVEGGKPGEFTLYSDFTILPGDNLEMIELGAVEGYKVYYVIVTE